jgi:hypothetical protein
MSSLHKMLREFNFCEKCGSRSDINENSSLENDFIYTENEYSIL